MSSPRFPIASPSRARATGPSRAAALVVAVAVLVALAVASGCGDGGSTKAPQAAPPTTPTTEVAGATDVDEEAKPSRPDGGRGVSLTVRSDRALRFYRDPGDREPAGVIPARTAFGSPLSLLVFEVGTGRAEGWLQVLVPGRPNDRLGWIRARDVTTRRVADAVRIDLAKRTLTVLHRGKAVLTTPVAIGDQAHPTPTGRFSVTDKLATGQAAGAYGPFAFGLSARSEVLTEFRGGDGQVGIHGTDEPAKIGQAVSHGCIRVPNDVAIALSQMLPLGTPVTVA